MSDSTAVIQVAGLAKRYRKTTAVKDVSFTVEKGQILGLIGPDGAGKTSVIQCLSGVLSANQGTLSIAGIDCLAAPEKIKGLIGYMPQGLGLNLYNSLSVDENIQFFRELRAIPEEQYQRNRERLLEMTRLKPFLDRPAEKLSGGMRQKLALICTLLHLPDVLLLDEPTTGVDPISRRDFWEIIHDIVSERQVTVLLSTAYLDEAERCDSIVMMHAGEVIAAGTPQELAAELDDRVLQVSATGPEPVLASIREWQGLQSLDQVGERCRILCLPPAAGTKPSEAFTDYMSSRQVSAQALDLQPARPSLEDVFVAHMTASREDAGAEETPSAVAASNRHKNIPERESAVTTRGISCHFGDFKAVDRVDLAIDSGEIFGLLGPNGAGKTTLIKMLCGLQRITSGTARVLGCDVLTGKKALRHRIGYMSQKFSLYRDLSARENMALYGGLFGLANRELEGRIGELIGQFQLDKFSQRRVGSLPLGMRQRVALACALLHQPQLLFLDEPTSGVDPIARRQFWRAIHELTQRQGVTVIVSTHYMDEAEHCHRLGFMREGRMVVADTPAALKAEAVTRDGGLIAVMTEQFAQAFRLLKPVFSEAIYYGRRIQWQSRNMDSDRREVEKILSGHGIEANVEELPLSVEEAFVNFIEHDSRRARVNGETG